MTNFLSEAKQLFEYSQALRRDFHQYPELAFQEIRTAGIVARELNELGLEVKTGVGETGVVALLETEKPGPVVLLRFDMDALPIEEKTGAIYASNTPGVMHACGHDGHTAIGLTVAKLLYYHRDALAGSVKLVFQPAEEIVKGARRMIDDGVLNDPRPDFALAMHLWNTKPLGWFGATPGPNMAASSNFHVRLEGRGGHGASPHLTKDPILAAAQIVSSLQSVVSRNVPPLESAVVSVTHIHAGKGYNVIPSTLELGGTIRAYDPKIREVVADRVREIVQGVAQSLSCQAEFDLNLGTVAVVNDPQVTDRINQTITRLFPDGELARDYRTMGSEDMAEILAEIPGCYFFVGSGGEKERLSTPHHHPEFDFEEAVLPLAAGLMAAAAADLLTTN